MLLTVSEINFSYADNLVLKDVGFAVQENDRIGVVGDNGCGKTTLLELICGGLELQPGGCISLKRNAQIGYLKQSAGLNERNTVFSEMETVQDSDAILSRMKQLEKELAGDPSLLDEYSALCERYEAIGGYELNFRIRRVLLGLNFPEADFEKPISALSGGEKTRLAMAKLLVWNPDLIVLDEPTNHLDRTTSLWLRGFLAEYKGAVLIVSHDTAFLDGVCNRILELENHSATLYSGNYSAYRVQKEQKNEDEERRYKRTVEQARELEDYAKRNIVRASTSNMAKSRLKMLGRLDLTAPENHSHDRISFRFPETPLPYKELLTVKGLTVGVSGKTMFECGDFVLLRGENLAVTGDNGTGKTTFLKTLLRKTAPLKGSAKFGGGVKTAYFEQNIFTDIAKNSLDFIWDLYPSMSALEIRNLLATAGLRGEEVFIPVNELSGGERARLMLCRLSLLRPNVLVLDEPTNHLDVYSRGILCDTLKNFFGTLILVSHDEELISELNCRILNINNGVGRVYESYAMSLRGENDNPPSANAARSKGENPKEQRRQTALLRARKSELETLITECEAEIAALETEIADPAVACDAERLTEACAKLDGAHSRLDEYGEEWLTLCDQ